MARIRVLSPVGIVNITSVAAPPLPADLTGRIVGFIDNNNNDVADTGDTLVYHFTVHNTGTGTLTEINVSDPDGIVIYSVGLDGKQCGNYQEETAAKRTVVKYEFRLWNVGQRRQIIAKEP